NELKLGIAVTARQPGAIVSVTAAAKTIAVFKRDLSPAKPLVESIKLPKGIAETHLLISVHDRVGRELISFQPASRVKREVPSPAAEPWVPRDIASADELYITGLHLDQYRHATRSPALYWREAVRPAPPHPPRHNA